MAFLQRSGTEHYFFADRYIGSNARIKVFHYITPDTFATVEADDYFQIEWNGAINPGDIIHVRRATNRNDLSTIVAERFYRVVERTASSIVIEPQTWELDLISDLWVSIDPYVGSDPVDEDDIGTSDIDDEETQTAALNSAWVDGGGIPETGLLTLPVNAGLPVFLPGGPEMVYTFVASAMASKFIKAFGRGSYRIYEDGVGAYVDEDGVAHNVTGSLSQVFRLSSTPQYLYAPPDTSGDRNINEIDAPDATLIDPRYFGSSFIKGRWAARQIQYGGNLHIQGPMQVERPIRFATAATIIGRRQLRFTRFLNRVAFYGTENGQRAFTDYPHLDGHPYFDSLAEANSASVEDVWVRTGTVGSGERNWLEADAAALVGATTYNAGQRVVTGGNGYVALEDGLLGSDFAADLAAGAWKDLGPRTKSAYSGATITTLGRVGTERVPRYRGDPATPGAWIMAAWAFGRDNFHNVLDGEQMAAFGYANASGSVYIEGVGLMGSHNFDGNRILTDTYAIGGNIGGNMIVSRKNVFGGRNVLKNTSRARYMTVFGDGSGTSIGCSTFGGANPMTFELETDEPFAAQYGAIVGADNCLVVPNGFTSSFIGGYGNLDSATIVSNDIVLGHLNLVTTTASLGGRIVIANRHPNTANLNKYLTIGHYAWRSKGIFGADLENGGVIFNNDVAADITTATTCDLIIGPYQFYSKNGLNLLFYADTSGEHWFRSSDAGGSVDPILNLFRDSASPAAADALGNLRFQGRNAAAAIFNYGGILMTLDDPTAGSEDGTLALRTALAGTVANRILIGGGIYSSGVTGGDKGVGTGNFTTLYEANVSLAAKYHAKMTAAAAEADLVAITGGEPPTETEHNLVVTKVNSIITKLETLGLFTAV